MSTDLKEFQAAQRDMLASLDKTVAESNRASHQRANDFMDWAMRRVTPNPKFDDEWKI